MGGVLDREEIKAYTVLHYMHLAEYMTYTNIFFYACKSLLQFLK